MLFKETIVVWSDSEEDLKEAADFAIEAIRNSDNVTAFGHATVQIDDPANDPDYEPSVEEMFGV